MLAQHSHELMPAEADDMPYIVRERVVRNSIITKVVRFRARNYRKVERIGFGVETAEGRTILVEEGEKVLQGHKYVPAYGISVVSESVEKAVDARFCHTVVQLSLAGYNIPVE